MRRYLLPFLLLCAPALAWAKSGTVLYVCAHPDDCLLFMNPNLYDDITRDADKVVVVYLTSGDAGLPFSQEGPTISYPYVREQASIEATEWMADVGKEPISAHQETEAVVIQDHTIDRVSYGNTVSYFLRLPDGNMMGDGFDLYNHESLRKLKTGEITSIIPVDGEAPYTGWQDLIRVVSSILARETEGETNVSLHIQDPDTTANPTDHSDHTTGGGAVMEALAQGIGTGQGGNRCYKIYKHIDYSITQKPFNLEGAALENKAGAFAVLTATQRHYLDHHHWDEAHLSYLPRNYYTTMSLPEGCAK